MELRSFGTQLPHDAQVRRISWVVGLVGRYVYPRFLVPLCIPTDPQNLLFSAKILLNPALNACACTRFGR